MHFQNVAFLDGTLFLHALKDSEKQGLRTMNTMPLRRRKIMCIGLAGILTCHVQTTIAFSAPCPSRRKTVVSRTMRFGAKQVEDTPVRFSNENLSRSNSVNTLSTIEEEELLPEESFPIKRSNNNNNSTSSLGDANGGTLPFASDMNKVLRNPQVEVIFVGLVLLSSFCVAYGTLQDPFAIQIAKKIEMAVSYIFATEFVLRLYANFGKQPLWQYLSKPLVLVDIVVVILPLLLSQLHGEAAVLVTTYLPNWLSSSSGLINLRLLRILRIQRILKDMETFSNFEEALGFEKGAVRPYQLQLARVLLSVFTLLSVSTGLIYTTEHKVNPDIPDYFTALYFGLTTLTTVGFGDIRPITTQGKFVVSASILAGVAVIPAQAARFVEALLDYQKERDAKRRDDELEQHGENNEIDMFAAKLPHDGMVDAKTVCRNCNAGFHWSNADYCWSCGSPLMKSRTEKQ